jgi:hypothetical protein
LRKHASSAVLNNISAITQQYTVYNFEVLLSNIARVIYSHLTLNHKKVNKQINVWSFRDENAGHLFIWD